MKFQNIGKLQCAFVMALFVFFLPASGFVLGQATGDKIDMGAYKLNRAPAPQLYVTGIEMKKTLKAHFAGMNITHESLNGKFGRLYRLFDPETKRQINMSAVVYGDVASAENAALELLNSMSGVFAAGSQSGKRIGTHSWYLVSRDGSGAMVFVYDNSLFHVFSSDFAMAERQAVKILDDLRAGQNGIRLGQKVTLPRITGVKMPKALSMGIQEKIVVEGEDMEKRRLEFFVSATAGQVNATAQRTVKMYNAERPGTDELTIYAINDLNVVSEVFTKKVEIKEGN